MKNITKTRAMLLVGNSAVNTRQVRIHVQADTLSPTPPLQLSIFYLGRQTERQKEHLHERGGEGDQTRKKIVKNEASHRKMI